MATTSRKSSKSAHIVTRFRVTDGVVLSIAGWQNSAGMYLRSVALVRNGKIDGESCVEIVRAREDDAQYIASDVGAKLVASVLGECPFRFFRDSAL